MNKFQEQTIQFLEDYLKDKENAYKITNENSIYYSYEKRINNHTYRFEIKFLDFENVDWFSVQVFPGIQITMYKNTDKTKLFCQEVKLTIGNLEVDSTNEVLYRAELPVQNTVVTLESIKSIENEAITTFEAHRGKLYEITNGYTGISVSNEEFTPENLNAPINNLNLSIKRIEKYFHEKRNSIFCKKLNKTSPVLYQRMIHNDDCNYLLEISTNHSFLIFKLHYGNKSLFANPENEYINDYINYENSTTKICKLQVDDEGKIFYKLTFSLFDGAIPDDLIEYYIETLLLLAIINRADILKLLDPPPKKTPKTLLEIRKELMGEECDEEEVFEQYQFNIDEIDILDISTKSSEIEKRTEEDEDNE